jgi:hypothetical protein
MITEEQVGQFQKKLKRGAPDGEVREEMLKLGYTADDIGKVFRPKPYDMRSWYMSFGLLVTGAGLFLLITRQNFLILLLGVLLLMQYYREEQRIKRLENKSAEPYSNE